MVIEPSNQHIERDGRFAPLMQRVIRRCTNVRRDCA